MIILQKIKEAKQLHKLFVYGFGQLFNLATPLLIIPYIVACCGEENFGKTAISLSIFLFLIVFIDYGTDLTGVREVAINRNNRDNLKKILLQSYSARFINLLIVITIAFFVFTYVPFFAREKYMYIFGVTILLGQYLSPVWFLQGIENVLWITILNIISRSIYVAAIFLFINTPDHYIYVNFFMGLGMFTANLFFLIVIFVKYNVSLKNIDIYQIKLYLKGNLSIFSSQFFTAIQLNAPVFLIGFFGSNLLAGQYRIIEQIILMFKTYIFLFFNFLFPKICFLLQQNKLTGLKTWLIYNLGNFIFVTISMGVLWQYSDYVVAYFNSADIQYMAGLLKTAVFIPIAMVVAIALKQLVLAWNYTKNYFRATVFAVTLNLVAIIYVLQDNDINNVFYLLFLYELLLILLYIAIVRNNIWRGKNNSDV